MEAKPSIKGLFDAAFITRMIGLFSSKCRLKARVERLVRCPSVTTLRPPIAAGLLLGMALVGSTDAMPGAWAQAPKEALATKKDEPLEKTHTVSGRCFNQADSTALAGITVRLYRVEGRTSPPVEIAKTITDANGRYTFAGLEPPRPENLLDRLNYGVYGFADDRPIGISFFHFDGDKEVVEIKMAREKSTLSGKVINAVGRPVAGATVLPYFVVDRPAPALLSATTDAEGRFKLDNIGVNKWPGGEAVTTSFTVQHPDHIETRGEASALPADVVVTLPISLPPKELESGQIEITVRLGFFLGVLLLMAFWEMLAPRRMLTVRRVPRWGNHLGLVAMNVILVRLLVPITSAGAAKVAESRDWGLLHLVDWPHWLEIGLAILVFDLAIYLQHVMFHAVPALWRLHMVHHADLDFDVTTGLRFHTLEIVLSAFIKLATVVVLGPSVLAVVIFEVLLNATAMFNHSNVRMAAWLDRVLRWIVVTPDMHRVHHSVIRREANSNFGFNLPWWDSLLGTYRSQPSAGHEQMTIGVAHLRDELQVERLHRMLAIPFQCETGMDSDADPSGSNVTSVHSQQESVHE